MNEIENTQNNQIETLHTVETFQFVPVNCGENSVKVGRGKRGRFINGNNFSVGNKGGRPKNLSLEDVLADPERLESLYERAMDGDTDSLITVVNLLEGKNISSSRW